MNPPGPLFVHRLERLTLLHAGAMLLFASWTFGGNIWWARDALTVGGALAVPLIIAGARASDVARQRLLWLLPLMLFAVLALVSCLNPSFVTVVIDGLPLRAHRGATFSWLPSTVDAARTLRELAFLSAVYLTGFALALNVHRRRALRAWLAVAVGSAAVLAVLGTLQKLTGHSLYFGAAESPNLRFFATFLYANHWGAFATLAACAAAGLLFHHAGRSRGRDVWHTPAPACGLALLMLLIAAPVCGSRSATFLAALVLGAVLLVGARFNLRAIVASLALSAGALWLAWPSVIERGADTREQLDRGFWSERLAIYGDTWALARENPVFGWGLESFSTAISLKRPPSIAPERVFDHRYAEAHSDWLQSLAETGFVGTALALGAVAFPLVAAFRARGRRSPIVVWTLAGCGLVAAYACVEFPFANGAVLVAFWTFLFAAARYAELSSEASES